MSNEQPPPDSGNDAFWYDFLTLGSPHERRNRRIELLKTLSLHVASLRARTETPADVHAISDRVRPAREATYRASTGALRVSTEGLSIWLAGVTTIGCRRCGGGLAGKAADSNVLEGARLAAEREPEPSDAPPGVSALG